MPTLGCSINGFLGTGTSSKKRPGFCGKKSKKRKFSNSKK
jgi:hypothetical protein